MAELEQIELPSAQEVREKLTQETFRNLEPQVVPREEIEVGWIEMSRQEIIDAIFEGDDAWADTLLKVLDARPEMQFYRSDSQSELTLEVLSWNGDDDFAMRVIAPIEGFKSRYYVTADNIWIINKKTGVAFSYTSLFAPQINSRPRGLQYNFERRNASGSNKQELITGNVRWFSHDYDIHVGEVHTNITLSSILHELGHIWAKYLHLHISTKRQMDARRKKFSFVEGAEKDGPEATLHLAKEIGISERLANIIGRVLSAKLRKKGFFGEHPHHSEVFSPDHRSSATYDMPHAALHLDRFEEAKYSFVNRANRTEKGREQMIELNNWITAQVENLLEWTQSLPSELQTIDTQGSITTQTWKSNSIENRFYCSIARDSDGNFKKLEIRHPQKLPKIYILISSYRGIQFDDTTRDLPYPTVTIQVGMQDPQLPIYQEKFLAVVEQLKSKTISWK